MRTRLINWVNWLIFLCHSALKSELCFNYALTALLAKTTDKEATPTFLARRCNHNTIDDRSRLYYFGGLLARFFLPLSMLHSHCDHVVHSSSGIKHIHKYKYIQFTHTNTYMRHCYTHTIVQCCRWSLTLTLSRFRCVSFARIDTLNWMNPIQN